MAPTLAPPGLGTSLAPSPHHTHPVSTSQGHRDTPPTHSSISLYAGSSALVCKWESLASGPLKSFLLAPTLAGVGGDNWVLSSSLGDSFLCTGLRCTLGLEPWSSGGILPPPAPVWWQLPPAPVGIGTQGGKSSVLHGWPRELALKPRGLLFLGSHCRCSQEMGLRCGHPYVEPPQPCQD